MHSMTPYFDNSLIVAVVGNKKIYFAAKKVEACAILYFLKRARDFGYHKIYIVFDAQ